MKQTRRELSHNSFYDFAGIQAHLEDMAAKGWMLEEIGALGWKYRRTEPAALRFSVTYFPNASDFDPAPSEAQSEMADYCAEAGWRLVARSAQMQVFCTDSPTAVAVETDAAVQVSNIHRAMKKNYLPGQAVMLVLALFQIGMQLSQLHSRPISFFTAPTSLFIIPCWLLVLALCALELGSYIRWHRKATAAAQEDGSLVLPHSHSRIQRGALVLLPVFFGVWLWSVGSRRGVVFALLGVFSMFLLITLVNLIKYLLKRRQISAGINRAVTVGACFVLSFAILGALTFLAVRLSRSGVLNDHPPVETYSYKGMTWEVYHDPLPLTVQDLMPTNYDGYSTEADTKSTVFMSLRKYSQEARLGDPSQPELTYEIVTSPFPALCALAEQEFLQKDRFLSEEASGWQAESAEPWGADAVYRYFSNREPLEQWLVRWPNRVAVLHFYFDGPADDAQLALAAQALRTA